MKDNFSVNYRNYGHWDIWNNKRRIFCIRGGPGKYLIRDERYRLPIDHPNYIPEGKIEVKFFKTVQACMGYICDELMFELIVAEGQEPQIIESWNVI